MADTASSKVVVTEFYLTFGGTEYDVKSIAPGIAESAEPPDVTVGRDVEMRYDAAAMTEDADIVVTMSSAPSINAEGALVLKKKQRVAGAAASAEDVTVGNCIVTDVKPADITVDGDHVKWYDVTFTPKGSRT